MMAFRSRVKEPMPKSKTTSDGYQVKMFDHKAIGIIDDKIFIEARIKNGVWTLTKINSIPKDIKKAYEVAKCLSTVIDVITQKTSTII